MDDCVILAILSESHASRSLSLERTSTVVGVSSVVIWASSVATGASETQARVNELVVSADVQPLLSTV